MRVVRIVGARGLSARVLGAIAIVVVMAPLPVGAADRAWPSEQQRATPLPEQPPCTCRSPRGPVEVGRDICLATPDGTRRARCLLVGNNTSWEIGTDTCQTVSQLTR